jgi:hypothetical protein
MTERITEAELRRMEDEADEPTRYSVEANYEKRMLAEIRRLRALIADMDRAFERVTAAPMRGGTILRLSAEEPAFFNEARAIREEQNG